LDYFGEVILGWFSERETYFGRIFWRDQFWVVLCGEISFMWIFYRDQF